MAFLNLRKFFILFLNLMRVQKKILNTNLFGCAQTQLKEWEPSFYLLQLTLGQKVIEKFLKVSLVSSSLLNSNCCNFQASQFLHPENLYLPVCSLHKEGAVFDIFVSNSSDHQQEK